jgi:hypothetical protein
VERETGLEPGDQPAWKADRRDNVARLLPSGSRRAFANHARHLSSNEADGYLLSLSSYPLLLQKASYLGKMFYKSSFGNNCIIFQTLLFERISQA